MRILGFYTPLPGCDPLNEHRMIAKWAAAWTVAGFAPFCATRWHLETSSESKAFLEAFNYPLKHVEDVVSMLGWTQYLLKDGEVAMISHYDCFPGENPWALPTDLSRAWWAGPLWFGVKERLGALTAFDLPGVFVHYDTPELRAQLGIKPVQWPADKAEPTPTTQFGPQFAPRIRRG